MPPAAPGDAETRERELAALADGPGEASHGAGGTDEDVQRTLAFLARAAGDWLSLDDVPADAAIIRVTAERYLELAPRARRYRAELASALDALDEQLIASGQYAEAFTVAARAIPAWRELADGSASGQAYLARALGELSGRLAYFGRHDEAMAARTEAVRIYRELAEKSPGRYGKRLRVQAGQLRGQCEDRDLPYPPEARDLELD